MLDLLHRTSVHAVGQKAMGVVLGHAIHVSLSATAPTTAEGSAASFGGAISAKVTGYKAEAIVQTRVSIVLV